MTAIAPETTEIREAHQFDISVLEQYLRDHLKDFSGKLTVRQFTYGQSNPTFVLDDGNRRYVLRKKPPGKLLPSAHAVDREHRIISALQDTDVPVAKTYLFCADATLIGTPFYVMEFVEGRIFRDVIARDAADAKERSALFHAMNETLAKIHLVDWASAGLSGYGKPGNYMARQVSRWAGQYEAAKTSEIKSMDALIQWLKDNIPPDEPATIVHGDWRLENMIIHPEEPRVVAVLDWEISTLGHPLADLAYNCMNYHLPAAEDRTLGFVGLNLEELGIPAEADYVGEYCALTRRAKPANWPFFIAFSIFRLVAILQGVYKRGLDGIASSERARMFGEFVPYLAEMGLQVVRAK
jgi:aminoglycoside phosphotransferase (APT) family kinase protein